MKSKITLLIVLSFLFSNCLKLQAQTPATHLNFDGVNDRVELTLPSIFTNTTSNAFTVEAVINPSSLTFSRIFFAQYDVNNFFSITLSTNGQIYAYLNNTISAVTTTTVSTSTWTHVAVTKEATTNTILVYFNGVLQPTSNGGSSTTGNDNILTLGCRSNLAQFYNGSLDEVRIWNRVLAATEIQESTNCELDTPLSQTGLVAYYQFNQGDDATDNTTITSLADISAGGNNGTLINFTLTGTSSNWLAGSSVLTGITCSELLNTTSFNSSSNLKIYPNPATNTLFIDLLSIDNSNVEMYDSSGRKVLVQKLSSHSTIISIDNLLTGIYLLKVTSDKGIFTSKVVKN